MSFSVIIVTKNRNEYLKRSINSVINQTFKDFELIIICDGYDKETSKLVREYQDKYPNIFFYDNSTSMGANHCRNFGYKISKNEFVAFLDDDDIWLHDKLEKQLKTFSNTFADIVTCNFTYKKFNMNYLSSIDKKINKSLIFDLNYLGGMSGVVIKKKKLNDELFDNSLQSCQDWDFWISSILKKKNIVVHDEPLYVYSLSSNNKITYNLHKALQGRKKILLKYHSYINQSLKKKKINEIKLIENILKKKYLIIFCIIFNLNNKIDLRLKISYLKKIFRKLAHL